MIPTSLLLIPIFSLAVSAANDWKKPCLQGTCSYDLHPSTGASGSLKVWGSKNAISDITEAAGWAIIGCNPNALAQDIRLVCKSHDTTGAGCDHLFQSVGAVGKLVRLPENCGKSAFARVAKAWVPSDQSIPDHISSSIERRPGYTPKVHSLTLDTNFAAVDPSDGEVSIAIVGSNVPGATGDSTISMPSQRSRIMDRSLWSWIEDAFDSFNKFDENITKTLTPVDVNKDFPLFDVGISCPANGNTPAYSASAKADLMAKAHVVVDLGVAATGTIIPPKITSFGLFAGLNAELDGTLNIHASAAGSFDSGSKTLFELGIPGLDFPGILSIGPTFKIDGQAKASLDVELDVVVDINYHINNAKLFFPASANHQSGGGFTPADTALTLSVSPSVTATGNFEAHLIPHIDVGISALGGIASATVFLKADASANLDLSFHAQAPATTVIDWPIHPTLSLPSGWTFTPIKTLTYPYTIIKPTSFPTFVPVAEKAKRESNEIAELPKRDVSVNGCIDLRGALNVNAGAQADFFGLFNPNTQVPLFNKQFEIYNKCFGSFTKRDALPRSKLSSSSLARRAASCPSAGVTTPVNVVSQVISGSSITSL